VLGTLIVWARHVFDADTTVRLEQNHTVLVDVVRRLGKVAERFVDNVGAFADPDQPSISSWRFSKRRCGLPRLDPRLDGTDHHAPVRPPLYRTRDARRFTT
jgi:hypothetical protein